MAHASRRLLRLGRVLFLVSLPIGLALLLLSGLRGQADDR